MDSCSLPISVATRENFLASLLPLFFSSVLSQLEIWSVRGGGIMILCACSIWKTASTFTPSCVFSNFLFFRSFDLYYSADVDVEGVPARRYVLPEREMVNATLNPEQAIWYSFGPSGLLNLSSAEGTPCVACIISMLQAVVFKAGLIFAASNLLFFFRPVIDSIWRMLSYCWVKCRMALQNYFELFAWIEREAGEKRLNS